MKNLKTFMACAAFAALASACCDKSCQTSQLKSGLDPAAFDTTINGKQVKLYTLTNANGMEVCITNYGGRVVSLVVPDKDGKPTDVVLGYDNIAQYADTLNSPSDYGSSVGRYANRINGGKFTLNGTDYQLKQNDGANCLHGGGTSGWMNQVYDAEQVDSSTLKLTIKAQDGENGFPGNVTAVTTYKVTEDNTLDITWEATTDKETIINQTNHNYYNLNGKFDEVGTDMELYRNVKDTGTVIRIESEKINEQTHRSYCRKTECRKIYAVQRACRREYFNCQGYSGSDPRQDLRGGELDGIRVHADRYRRN